MTANERFAIKDITPGRLNGLVKHLMQQMGTKDPDAAVRAIARGEWMLTKVRKMHLEPMMTVPAGQLHSKEACCPPRTFVRDLASELLRRSTTPTSEIVAHGELLFVAVSLDTFFPDGDDDYMLLLEDDEFISSWSKTFLRGQRLVHCTPHDIARICVEFARRREAPEETWHIAMRPLAITKPDSSYIFSLSRSGSGTLGIKENHPDFWRSFVDTQLIYRHPSFTDFSHPDRLFLFRLENT